MVIPPSKTTRPSPAKINIFLRVTGRRSDGYHEIDSLFLPLELGDEVTVETGPGRRTEISCACPGYRALDGPDNLAARAAAAYLEAGGVEGRVAITLRKQIWVAAGMGGGSSNAAAVLLALQGALSRLDGSRLPRIARDLGADVPFFLAPRPTWVSGIGEQLHPAVGIPAVDLVLANPGVPLLARDVYEGLKLPPGTELTSGADTPVRPEPCGLEDLVSLVHNDLEATGIELCPQVARLEQALDQAGALASGMSGSGPTVFGIFSTAVEAGAAADKILKSTGFPVLTTKTVAA